MVLAVAVGFVLRILFAFPQAPLFTLVLGVALAPLVPAKKSCGLAGRRDGAESGPDSKAASGDHPRA